MTDDRTGRELTPRPSEPEGVVTPREPVAPGPVQPVGERFYAGDKAHTVGLTEERTAEITRQSSNARYVAFLAALIFVLFIPIYWLYAIGLPVIGVQGQMDKEAEVQYVTDVSRGYALFLANCARCHGNNGEGGIGPPLNDQMKLFNAITPQGLPGTGHLNPNYLHNVLQVGGRYVCGDPKSAMPAWLEPAGPLNYREVEEIITFILATSDTEFTYVPAHPEADATLPPPVDVQGWRDPNFTPAPGATPVPACWRAPGSGGTPSTPAPVTSPGTADNPRVVELEASAALQWVDPTSEQQVSSISLVQGETVEFHIINETPALHNFHLGNGNELAIAPEQNDLPGIDSFSNATQTFVFLVDQLAADSPQFACTVQGHYQSMHGDIFLVTAGGEPGASPAASPAGSGAPTESAAPSAAAPSAAAPSAVAPSPAPSAAP